MKKNDHNVIPNKFSCIKAIQLSDTNAGKINDIWHIYKNDFGLLGLNKRTGKYFYIFRSHLRIKEQWQILNIER